MSKTLTENRPHSGFKKTRKRTSALNYAPKDGIWSTRSWTGPERRKNRRNICDIISIWFKIYTLSLQVSVSLNWYAHPSHTRSLSLHPSSHFPSVSSSFRRSKGAPESISAVVHETRAFIQILASEHLTPNVTLIILLSAFKTAPLPTGNFQGDENISLFTSFFPFFSFCPFFFLSFPFLSLMSASPPICSPLF